MFMTPDLPHTSDGGVQIPRLAAYYKAIEDGALPVRWAGYLNYGYGLPVFNFMYHTPYIVAAFFIGLGFGLVTTFKLVLYLSFLLSGIFMYLFCLNLTKKPVLSFAMAVVYQFTPFRLEEIVLRGAVGSIYAYTFLPLVLFGIDKTANRNKSGFYTTAIATSLLVISHNALSLLFFLAAILYVFLIPVRTRIIPALVSLFTGLLMSSWYFIPAIFEHKYTYGNLFMKDMYKSHFQALDRIIIQPLLPPGSLDPVALRLTEIQVHAGLVGLVLFLIALISVSVRFSRMETKHKKIFIYSTVLISICLFFLVPGSGIIWQNLPLLRQFQFPWRFMGLVPVAFALCLYPISAKKNLSTGIIAAITILSVASTWYYWIPPLGYDRIKSEKSEFWEYPLNTTYYGETDVIWSEGPAKSYPDKRIEVIGGSAKIKDFTRSNQHLFFEVDAKTKTQLLANIQYFPGWKTYVDKTQVPIQFQDVNHRGLITFDLPAGSHEINIKFTESKIRIIADLISVFTMILFISYYLINSKLRPKAAKHETD